MCYQAKTQTSPLIYLVRRGRCERRAGLEPACAVPPDAQRLRVHQRGGRARPAHRQHDQRRTLPRPPQLQGPGYLEVSEVGGIPQVSLISTKLHCYQIRRMFKLTVNLTELCYGTR